MKADGRGLKRLPGWNRFLLMALYLWVIFGLFALYQNILLRQHGIDYEMTALPCSTGSSWERSCLSPKTCRWQGGSPHGL
jgi:hypothetical protein